MLTIYHSLYRGYILLPDTNWRLLIFQVLGLVRPPGFNRLPAPGEEVILSYIPFTHVASQTIDIYYSITIAGTLCFVDDGRDLVTVSFEVSKTSLES